MPREPARLPGRADHRISVAKRVAQILPLMPVVSITVLVPPDTARRIAVTKLTAAFIISAPGGKLCAVKSGKQSPAAHLPRNRGQSVLRTGRASGGVLRCIVHARTGAAVGIAHQYAPN